MYGEINQQCRRLEKERPGEEPDHEGGACEGKASGEDRGPAAHHGPAAHQDAHGGEADNSEGGAGGPAPPHAHPQPAKPLANYRHRRHRLGH